jgi:hypothetical protein
MSRPPITPLLLGLLVLPGCPSPSSDNPRVLWLAPDMTEIRVKLVDSEPAPF